MNGLLLSLDGLVVRCIAVLIRSVVDHLKHFSYVWLVVTCWQQLRYYPDEYHFGKCALMVTL